MQQGILPAQMFSRRTLQLLLQLWCSLVMMRLLSLCQMQTLTIVSGKLTLNLTFDKPVNGLTSGTDSTVFNDGDSGVAAAWGGDNGSATRTLTYTVANGDSGTITISETALTTALENGITDSAGNAFSDTIDAIDDELWTCGYFA